MAPPRKRKAGNADDFILTISDNEDIGEEIPDDAPPPKRKKSRHAESEPAEGAWGRNDEDDGAMNPDFEFVDDKTQPLDENFHDWNFSGTSKYISASQRASLLPTAPKAPALSEFDEEAEAPQDDNIDLDDDDDEVLAADGFGMGVGSDVEESGDEVDDDAEEDAGAEGSDDESVATPEPHPDDDKGSDSSDDDEDPEEAAKRADFFAPEEKAKPGRKNGTVSFQEMKLSRAIMRGLTSAGFTNPTPIQAKTIPIALTGKDVVGGAVTGSGKTGAFLVPILDRLFYRPRKVPSSRVVILTPTRELAIQCHAVATKLASYTDIKFSLAVGGLSLKVQEAELRLRPDVIIATPGRFIDHMRNSATFAVEGVEILVLDEADRMLEDGFADELNEILTTLPKARQTMLFSATMNSSVDNLIRVGLNKPVRLMVDSQKKTVGTLTQEFVRLRPGREEKRMGYLLHLCKTLYTDHVIIFFRQKKQAQKTRVIFKLLGLSCAELHGSMNQAQRIASVEAFRDGKVSFLLASDVASRGLDIKGVDTVINFESPATLDVYIHRIGRTARAGRRGVAVTLAAEPDRKVVKAAVKAGRAQGAKITSRTIDVAVADKWQSKVDELDDKIDDVVKQEKAERQLAQMEMQLKKGENMIVHEDEIKSRPKRTWFQSEREKQLAKKASGSSESVAKLREQMKKKNTQGKLSNKDKKRLDSKSDRVNGRVWKKGKPGRGGGGRK